MQEANPLDRIKMAGGVSMFGGATTELTRLSLKDSVIPEVPEEKEETVSIPIQKKQAPPIPSKGGTLSRTNSGLSKLDDDSLITEWIVEKSHVPLPEDGDLWAYLNDGVVLCKVVNALLEPLGKKTVKINTGKFPQQQMVRILNIVY